MGRMKKHRWRLDFIGLGVTKSGSTWTWRQLVKHPEICKSIKEAYYFKPNTSKFRTVHHMLFSGCGNDQFIGEYSPSYFFDKKVPFRIKEYSPKSKFLLILRNPADRSYSQWKFSQFKAHGEIKIDFKTCFKRNLAPKGSYPRRNRYANHLRRWFRHFPREQFHIALYDDLVANPLKFIQDMYAAIGADPSFIPPDYTERERKAYNVYFEKNPVYMSPEDRDLTLSVFEDSIFDLQRLIGRDLTHWFY